MRKAFGVLSVIVLAAALAQAGYLMPDLQVKLDQAAPDQMLKVIVQMNREADISVLPSGQREAMVKHLQDFAAESQRDILAALPGYGEKVAKVKPFWICNRIALEATKDVVLDLAKRSDVDHIEEDKIIKLEAVQKEGGRTNTVEWNINMIQARQAWAAGYNGAGIVVGNMDTGVLVTHVTFGGRWRGGNNSWFDGVAGQTNPYDDHGHGTHTMGTICGGSTADTIGVARGATFVAAKAFDSGGSGQTSWILACYQWFAGLGSAAPNVVNNSWGSSGSTTTWWQPTRNLQILGIHQSYSNGNSGPGGGTVGAPAAYPHNIGIGATTSSDGLASYSSRGPSPSFGAMESTANYMDPAWAASRRKPDLSAPGDNVRSSLNTGGYGSMSGTSMASPHVTGVIALMLQKNRNLTDRQIWQILTASCDTPAAGRPYPNQNWGWGRLNAFRAVTNTPGASGPYIALAGFSYGPPPMRGITVAVVDTISNTGQGALNNARGTLRTTSPYAQLTDSTFNFGNIAPGSKANNGSAPFHFVVSGSTPRNTVAGFTLHIVGDTTGGQYITDLPFYITLYPTQPDTNGFDFYVLGDGDNSSGSTVANTLWNLGYKGKYYNDSTFVGRPAIAPYRSVWVFVPGIAGTNTLYRVMQTGGADETQMITYLNAGGRMYFEHADWGWAVDPASGGGMLLRNMAPMMGTNLASYNDYTANLSRETGTSGHFAQGMSFAYNPADTGGNGGLCDIDGLNPATGAFALFTHNTGANSAIAYDNGTHRTVVSPFLFHGLTDASPPSTKEVYADSIMHWFGIRLGVEERAGMKGLPTAYALGAARPNPASQGAEIRFALPLAGKASLRVYNLNGQLVSTLVEGQLPAGYHQTLWAGKGQPSGVYFYRLEAGTFTANRKLVLVR
jgi:subtilisin family serine protease